ncbi:MAG: hypothetical protein ACHQVS_04105 [Candidatus Babeliales bacterium]
MKIANAFFLLFFTVSLYAMESAQQPVLICSHGHTRRGSWPWTASDHCTQATYHNFHVACAGKGLQATLKKAGLKVENNQDNNSQEEE